MPFTAPAAVAHPPPLPLVRPLLCVTRRLRLFSQAREVAGGGGGVGAARDVTLYVSSRAALSVPERLVVRRAAV